MNVTTMIHKVPKWGLYGGAGLGLGGALLIYKKKRAVTSGDATGMAQNVDTGTAPPPVGPTGSSVIVPPVIIPPSNDPQTGILTGAISDLGNSYLQGTQSIMSMFGDVLGTVLGQNADITSGLFTLVGQQISNTDNYIQTLAAAGSAPQPIDVTVSTPAPSVDPAYQLPPGWEQVLAGYNTPGAVAPTKTADPCTGTYPYLNEANGQCYTVACASGSGTRKKGKWHLYKNPANDTWIGPTC